MGGVYVPRSPTTSVLHGVVRAHWSAFAAEVRDRTEGTGLPGFVVQGFRRFLRCGVLSVPHRLRYRLAYDHRLCRTVLGVFVRALRAAYRRQAKRAGLSGGETGTVTSIQRFGESLALAGLMRAAVLGRAALGHRAGRGPQRLGADPDAPWVDRHVPLPAHVEGFDLHAAVRVAAADRPRLWQLCHYLCRPPLGQERLQRLRDGRVALALQRPGPTARRISCSRRRSCSRGSCRWSRGRG
ncbi:MAG: transposase [bacterium]|nr:transposase [bacterium]